MLNATPAKAFGRWTIVAGIALALVGPLCFLPISDTDAGWHLALGRLIQQSGLPHVNALTWTARDVPWYDTSWLWDLTTYLWTARLGLAGLQLASLLVLALALWAAGWACVQRCPEGGALAVPALALLLVPRVVVRPHLAAWAALAVVLALCLRGERRGPGFRAACLPIIVLAGNLHSGAIFSAGLLGLFCLQGFVARRRPVELLIAASGVAALCANPGGLFDLRSMVFHLLHVQDVVVIGEYLPPTLRQEPVFFALVPLAIALAFRRRRESWAHLAALVLFAALAFKSVRMVYEFEILAAPALADGFGLLRERFGARVQVSLAVAAALACGASHRWERRLPGHLLAPSWDAASLPVRAAAFARAHGLGGRYFHAYDHGGYLEWALPEAPAFVDGRVQCFPPAFFRRFYVAGHGPQAFEQFLRELGVGWAMPLRTSPWLSGQGLLHANPGWALVYWDDLNELYLRRDLPAFTPLIETLEYRRFRPWGAIVGAVAATPRRELSRTLAEVDRFSETTPDDPLAAVVRCAASTRAGAPQATYDCARASRLARDERQRELVAAALRVPVAPADP